MVHPRARKHPCREAHHGKAKGKGEAVDKSDAVGTQDHHGGESPAAPYAGSPLPADQEGGASIVPLPAVDAKHGGGGLGHAVYDAQGKGADAVDSGKGSHQLAAACLHQQGIHSQKPQCLKDIVQGGGTSIRRNVFPVLETGNAPPSQAKAAVPAAQAEKAHGTGYSGRDDAGPGRSSDPQIQGVEKQQVQHNISHSHHQHHPGHHFGPTVHAEEPEGYIDQDLRQGADQSDGGVFPHQGPNRRIGTKQSGQRAAEEKSGGCHDQGCRNTGPYRGLVHFLALLRLLAANGLGCLDCRAGDQKRADYAQHQVHRDTQADGGQTVCSDPLSHQDPVRQDIDVLA